MIVPLFKACLLITGSGFCALIYQIVWMRELRLVFGASTAATAAVTAVFMGGLGAGSAILGKRADRNAQPMRLYAGLEFLVACLALVSPFLIIAARYLYTTLGGTMAMGIIGGTLVRLLLSGIILGGATYAMGGTLPALVRSMETTADIDRKRTGLLYGLNTAGAVLGAMTSTFWMIEVFGLQSTLRIAALINLLVAIAAWNIARSIPANKPTISNSFSNTKPCRDDLGRVRPSPKFIYIAAFITGFVFFLMEMVWYRMLSPVLGGTTYSFGLILAVALAGIGIGGGLYALIGGATAHGLVVLGISCGLEAVLLAAPYLMGDWLGVFAGLIHPLIVFGLTGQILSWGLVTMIIVFPAAVTAGYQFPLIIALLGRGDTDIGRHTGNAYAFNTAGAILGALSGGFGLMTALSAPGCWRLAVLLLLALSLAAIYFGMLNKGPLRTVVLLISATAMAGLLFTTKGPTAAWRHSPIGAGRVSFTDKTINEIKNLMAKTRRSVFWEMDGKESTIGLDRSNGYAFVVNGKIDGNAISDAPTQVMSGLIGAVVNPGVKHSLVVGLGTGSTAGWLAQVPSMTRVDVVEIEPGIVEVARACTPVNKDVLNSPKVNIIFDDAREILTTSDQQYDLIFSEPSNPYRAGIASLYTAEFYRETAKRLSPGGIFIQWVQGYEIAPRTVKSIYVTLSSVFPYIDTWRTWKDDMVLLCSLTPMRMNKESLATSLASEPFRSAMLNVWHTVGIEGFLSHFVANADFARMLSRASHPDWWLNTDDRMQIEFDFARTVGSKQHFQINDLRMLAVQNGHHRPAIDQDTVDWETVQEESLITRLLDTGNSNLAEKPATRQRSRIEAYTLFVQNQYKSLYDLVVGGSFQPVLPTDYMLSAMAKSIARDGSALEDIDILKQTRPTEAEAITTVFYWYQADVTAAMTHLENTVRKLRNDPWASPYCVLPALDVAEQMASLNGAENERIVNLLKTPFSTGLLYEFRMRLLLRVATLAGYQRGAEAVALFEPDIPWEADFLNYRQYAYREVNDPRSARAEEDYRLFSADEPKSLSGFVEK